LSTTTKRRFPVLNLIFRKKLISRLQFNFAMERLRRALPTLIKIAVSAGGMFLVLRQVNPADILDSLLTADWRWVALTFLLFNASLVLRAYRWALLLHGLAAPVRFQRLVELYFVGNFFNTFLPTSFGGDIVRAWEVTTDVSPGVAAGTVLVDRLTGLLALLVMSLLALPFRPEGFPAELVPWVAGLSIGGMLIGLLLLEGKQLPRWGGWLPGPLSTTGTGFVAQTLAAVQACGRRAVAGALLVSVFFNLMLVGWWWTAARALGLEISFTYLLLVIPILSVILLIPSIGGLGPRELIAPLLFSGAAVSAAQAYALSLLVFTVQRLSSLIGAFWYILAALQNRRKKG
jgi:uncharacterized membrane protein YbhN (UPF0104 family)